MLESEKVARRGSLPPMARDTSVLYTDIPAENHRPGTQARRQAKAQGSARTFLPYDISSCPAIFYIAPLKISQRDRKTCDNVNITTTTIPPLSAYIILSPLCLPIHHRPTATPTAPFLQQSISRRSARKLTKSLPLLMAPSLPTTMSSLSRRSSLFA